MAKKNEHKIMSLQKTIDWVNDIVTTNKRKKMIKNVAIQKAKKLYKEENNGQEMMPSRMENDYRGGIVPKSTRKYEQNREMMNKELQAKMKKKLVL